jgi:hypothetical protein
MPAPDYLAAAAARLDGSNDDRALGRQRRGHVCEMDTDHMGQKLRNTIYLYVGY